MPDVSIADAIRARSSVFASRPAWLRNVAWSAIGPKYKDGSPTAELAIQFLVDEKRRDLSPEAMVPPAIAGVTTDVLSQREGLDYEASAAPAESVDIGYGSPIVCRSGSTGTIGCTARDAAGTAFLVTSGHVIAKDEEVRLRLPGRPLIGRCTGSVGAVDAATLYREGLAAHLGTHLADIAAIAIEPDIRARQGVQGYAIVGRPPGNFDELMNMRLVGWGSVSRRWRQGVVTGLWPQRPSDGALALCMVHQSPSSVDGDSGGLWLEVQDDHCTAIGLHYGYDPRQDTSFAVLTDVNAALHLVDLVAVS